MRAWLWLGVTGVLVAGPAQGQERDHAWDQQPREHTWALTAEAGLVRFWGGAISELSNQPPVSIRPYRPTAVGLRLDRRLRRLRVGVGVQYAAPRLGGESTDGVILVDQGFTWIETALELGVPFAKLRSGAQITALGGPVFDIWTISGDGARTRLGGQLGVELYAPLEGRIGLAIRVRSALTGSVFDAVEVPPDYRRQAMPRGAIALGIRVGL